MDSILSFSTQATSKVAALPISRVKYLLMVENSQVKSHPDGQGNYKGYFDLIRRTFRHQGLPSFWKGGSVALLQVFSKMFLFSDVRNYLNKRLSQFKAQNSVAQTYSGLFRFLGPIIGITIPMMAISHPLQYLYIRMATLRDIPGRTNQFESVIDCIKLTFAKDGARGFFRGAFPSFWGMLAYRISFFSFYDKLNAMTKLLLNSESRGNLQMYMIYFQFITAQLTLLLSVLVAFPFEVISKRLMMQSCRDQKQFTTTIGGFKYILQQEGLKFLFRGLGINYLSAFGTASMLVVYDSLKTKPSN